MITEQEMRIMEEADILSSAGEINKASRKVLEIPPHRIGHVCRQYKAQKMTEMAQQVLIGKQYVCYSKTDMNMPGRLGGEHFPETANLCLMCLADFEHGIPKDMIVDLSVFGNESTGHVYKVIYFVGNVDECQYRKDTLEAQ